MSNIKQTIDENIYQNGKGLIRGDIMNNVLKAMVDDYANKEETNSKLSELEETTDGLSMIGFYLRGSQTGGVFKQELVFDADYFVTPYIKANGGDVLRYGYISNHLGAIVVYDAQRNVLDYWSQSRGAYRDITLPLNTAYVRASFYKGEKERCYININGVRVWNDISQDIKDTYNSIEKHITGAIKGHYIGKDGALISDYGSLATEFVKVMGLSEIKYNYKSYDGNHKIALYDANMNLLDTYGEISGVRYRIIPIASNCAYVRASFTITHIDDCFIADGNGNILWKYLDTNIKGIENKLDKKVEHRINYKEGFYIGAVSSSFTEVANGEWCISDKIPASNGDSFSLFYSSDNVSFDMFCCVVFDSNDNMIDYYRGRSMSNRVVSISVVNAEYIKVCFRKDYGCVILKDNLPYWVSQNQPIDEFQNFLRIATYNTGEFLGRGMQRGSEEVQKAMRQAVAETHANLIVTQDDTTYMDDGNTILPKDGVFGMYKYYFRNNSGEKNAIVSNYQIKGYRTINYSNDATYHFSHKGFIVGNITLGNKIITIINVHFDWADRTKRSKQIEQIISFINGLEYVIVLGDFNPENCDTDANGNIIYNYSKETHFATMSTHLVDFKKFTDAGYVSLNGGYINGFTTFLGADEPRLDGLIESGVLFPCDNIVLSSNIYVNNFGVTKADYMTDHMILWADIVIY